MIYCFDPNEIFVSSAFKFEVRFFGRRSVVTVVSERSRIEMTYRKRSVRELTNVVILSESFERRHWKVGVKYDEHGPGHSAAASSFSIVIMLLGLITRTRSVVQRSGRIIATQHRALSINHSVYVSRSTNPYFNLSLEDWFVYIRSHQCVPPSSWVPKAVSS